MRGSIGSIQNPSGMSEIKRNSIFISGIVQGVGFRPFIFKLANKYHLNGWVRNSSLGVFVEIEGEASRIERFLSEIKTKSPIHAKIDKISFEELDLAGYKKFEILESESVDSEFQSISPDIAVCFDCLNELFDPKDRRYRYPFINCTNCGPRFSIIKDIPYDRVNTTMVDFNMCPDCEREYKNPENRRFHAQPIVCAKCGPKVWLEKFQGLNNQAVTSTIFYEEEAVQQARAVVAEGKILAIKGLGGFHLACDAKNTQAVQELRQKKMRSHKPFAVMMADVNTVQRHCHLDEYERELIESPAHPIVILKRRSMSLISPDVAPGQNQIGVMLPYSPLHALLLEKQKGFPEVMVMTSGNISEEPICTDNIDARQKLIYIADAFLMHDRDIQIRSDDSVLRIVNKNIHPIRRSRGYTPIPITLPLESPPILAVGAELKNTFCLTNKNLAFVSHYIGDLQNYETLQSFENGIKHFEKLFKAQPKLIAHDNHPDYLSTQYALSRSKKENIKCINIQHHHAHIASLMAENGLVGDRQVIGVAFDGTGYGDDGAIWGGEFLVADYSNYLRHTHLGYFSLPGGDAAIRHPSRIALGLLHTYGLKYSNQNGVRTDLSENEIVRLEKQIENMVNTFSTSSVGRLFDAISSIIGIRHIIDYEAQAAVELEAIVDADEKGFYEFEYIDGLITFSTGIKNILSDLSTGVSVNKISSKFHNGLAMMVNQVCLKIKKDIGIKEVALSGGVWQNKTLLIGTMDILEKNGFQVFTHHVVPANDGGISLGQAAIASFKLNH